MSSPLRQILVTGATGKQGSALIRSLVSQPPSSSASTKQDPFKILALTRSTSSPAATKLASLSPTISLLQGDFTNVPAIFSQIKKPLWGIFIVTTPLKGAKTEEEQGVALVQGAVNHGVSHIIFTATDRGGDKTSDDNPTPIAHFASKYNVEREILRHVSPDGEKTTGKAQGQGQEGHALTYTFLRPVAFYENLTPDFFGKGFTSMWRLNGSGHKLQLISTADIGRIAADAFTNSSAPEYKNAAISLAGDELSPAEAARTFKEVTGKDIPETYGFVGRVLKWVLREQLGVMFDWFKSDGFGVDVGSLRKRYPFLMDFRTWVKEESAWKS